MQCNNEVFKSHICGACTFGKCKVEFNLYEFYQGDFVALGPFLCILQGTNFIKHFNAKGHTSIALGMGKTLYWMQWSTADLHLQEKSNNKHTV